jgi:hypothetical protein
MKHIAHQRVTSSPCHAGVHLIDVHAPHMYLELAVRTGV